MSDLLKDYPCIISQQVQWGDMDAANHVNNTVYLRYFESARVDFFNSIDFMDFTGEESVGPILAETNCKYKAPLTFPDNIKITARILPDSITEYGFTMQHVVYSEKLQRIAAEGTSRIVCYDYKNKRKALIPSNLLDKLRV
ncbi:acyl-CoA thioester hydrolase [Arcicella aurantiaca]|uniref:Acyl-CoA thioester hydrolase n=1 Tax=Arcicella aurantiaca TaxID=591202 RepID=A0A316EBJ0_9BACT|nr:thioesterase family protein [Arcicella aurantiaca]PWK27326.1 acyl-CoA thioester hydrolase [Arcicella aurantiaca]